MTTQENWETQGGSCNFRDIQRAQGGVSKTYWEELKRLKGM
jgi:hypothetical protein